MVASAAGAAAVIALADITPGWRAMFASYGVAFFAAWWLWRCWRAREPLDARAGCLVLSAVALAGLVHLGFVIDFFIDRGLR